MLFIVGVVDISASRLRHLRQTSTRRSSGLGTLDLALRDSYVASILVGNQLTERGSRNQLRTETSRVRLEGAEVTLEDANGNELATFSTLGFRASFSRPRAPTQATAASSRT